MSIRIVPAPTVADKARTQRYAGVPSPPARQRIVALGIERAKARGENVGTGKALRGVRTYVNEHEAKVKELFAAHGMDSRGNRIPPPRPKAARKPRDPQPKRVQAIHNADTAWLAAWASEADKAAQQARDMARIAAARALREE